MFWKQAIYAHHSIAMLLVWLSTPSYLIAGGLGLETDSLAALTVSSHLFDQSDAFGRNSC